MANELKHASQGTELTQGEFEGVGLHVFDSQATGDIVYASSSTQLTRLGKATDGDVLTLASGIPSWATITSVGTIGTGTWQGTAIASTYIANDSITLAKMASGTDGNIISYDASGNPVAIATGTDGQVLTSAGAGAPPAFEDAGGGGVSVGKSIAFSIIF